MIYTQSPLQWESITQRPLDERIQSAPQELIDFIQQYNAATGNPAVPQTAALDSEFLADLQSAIRELPEPVKLKLSPRLAGVFLMTGVGSSAVTDVVARADGSLIGAVVALDVEVFMHAKANAWASWRENTPFIQDGVHSVQAIIAEEAENSRKAALQFVLLHEFGHVLTANSHLMPNWWISPQNFQSTSTYQFLPFSCRHA